MNVYTDSGERVSENEVLFLDNIAKEEALKEMRANSSLRDDDWKLFDEELLALSRERLAAAEDLRTLGLTKNLGGLGTILSIIETTDDHIAAEATMDGDTKISNDLHQFGNLTFPVPLISRAFKIGFRQEASSRRGLGPSIETTNMAIAGRKVMDKIEDMVLLGLPEINVDGNGLFGYTNHPDRQTETIVDWATQGGAAIVNDVTKLLQKAYDVNRFGPFNLYVPNNFSVALEEDFSTEKGDNTVLERIEQFRRINSVRFADRLPDDNVVLVQMSRDSVDMGIAQDVITIETNRPMMLESSKFRVFGAMTIRIKKDENGSVGIVHGTV